ncbi:alpha/beta fold hydrolase [Hyphomicrobium sp.]|uniref:alpha/beta fold hydrolase n=1 Tax=Hyphomicrobium sp. TaxID=82 RepID=UPI002E3088C7|nr:alpha/beta fold hydrolase [Hyphomicrobium sp.]HEX2843456.1 alpha/beta fold hydrolase [Hyphomicrobium sp.]
MPTSRTYVRRGPSYKNTIYTWMLALALGCGTATADTEVPANSLAAAAPGTIFNAWPLEEQSKAAYRAYRILYRSTDHDGKPVAVSGAILVPKTPPTGKPRDVIAWSHPTTGVVPKCAPTLNPNVAGTVPGADSLIAKNYVIVATDYIGLGTKGTHPYLIGKGEAQAVLDSVRAARQFKGAAASDRFAVWGHSQGGHAALFTGETAAAYAPELKLVGVAAAAPVTSIVEVYKAGEGAPSGRILISMILYSWAHTLGLPLHDTVEPQALHHVKDLGSDCIATAEQFAKADLDERILEKNFLRVDPTDFAPIRKVMDQNEPGLLPAGTPVFVAQGTADHIARPAITEAHIKKMCSGGAKVKRHVMEGVGHFTAAHDSANATVEWISQRFNEDAPPDDC